VRQSSAFAFAKATQFLSIIAASRKQQLRNNMKSRNLLLSLGLIALTFIAAQWLLKGAQPTAVSHNWECAMIKWDGPDKLGIIYPDHAEVVRVFKSTKLPPDITEEEFCLTWGANKLAKEGWELVNLDSRRVLFRRLAAQ